MKIDTNFNVLIIGQHLTSRTEAVRDFLLPRVKSVTVVALGSAFIAKKENHLFFYEDGILKKHECFVHPILSWLNKYGLLVPATFFFYTLDILKAVLASKKKFDLAIGIAHFCGLVVVLLKSIGRSAKCLYYAIDYYAPLANANFFKNLFINIENYADRFALKKCDELWDLSPRISEARFQFDKLTKTVYEGKYKVAPLGYPERFFRNKEVSMIEKFALVFVGVIVEGQGLELLLESFAELKRGIPDIKVRIIGTGPYLAGFKGLVDKSGYSSNFIFYGFIESEEEMLEIISSSAAGISLWDDRNNKFLNSYLGDPGKTKLYSVCGLPVIVSNSTVYSQVVSRKKAGVAINYNKDELINAVRSILKDEATYAAYKSNAVVTGQDYCSSGRIFSALFN